jgi:predicted HTH transcriptional regulator
MVIFPTTLKEIKALIDDEIQESLHLDYKEARAVGKSSKQKADFGKHVSAFANSDGGVLIYGIQEKGHLPVEITGIDHIQFTREFIEQTIRTNISQPTPNFTVAQIPLNKKRVRLFGESRKELRHAPSMERR